jgi:hypothetical protein
MPDTVDDRLYLGAPEIAKRLFGSDDEKSCRRVYHLGSLPIERRPPFLLEIAGRLACFESGIRAAAGPAATDAITS